MLQIAIDHYMRNTKIKLILSGSHVAFMEEKVMGSKSPLYGRRTGMIQLKAFDYYDSGKMLPSFSLEEKVKFYGVLDGIPYYLSLIDGESTFEENVCRLFFETDGALFNEPELLIKQEFEAPARYNSIIEAVARGAQRPSQIEQITGIEKSQASAYIRTLLDIGFLAKEIPFGENPNKTRKGNYTLGNNMFRFWFTHVSPHFSDIQLGNGETIFKRRVSGLIENYIGTYIFETVCRDYLIRLNSQERLPFLASKEGKWWGNCSLERKQTDVDVIMADPDCSKGIILGECKWGAEIKERVEIDKLRSKHILFPNFSMYFYYFFLKNKFSEGTRKYADELDDLVLVELEDLFDLSSGYPSPSKQHS
jgi:AAA+ ATPase superfamily predicted ATPase